MDNEITTTENIRAKIYDIRGQMVMLDRDLAALYNMETSQLKRSVRRNIERFVGEDFMFELTKEEYSRCQIGILNNGRGHNVKYAPMAFTELGVAMLSSVLNSTIAIEMNRAIMRTFVAMRQAIASMANNELRFEKLEHNVEKLNNYIEDILRDQNDINEETAAQLELINETLAEMQVSERNKAPRKKIGFV